MPQSTIHNGGESILGRQVHIKFNNEQWYVATVVKYFAQPDEYKLVYSTDDGLEIAKLNEGDREWALKMKVTSHADAPVLVGSIIEFEYPGDGKRYQAMIYKHTPDGSKIKVAYLEDYSTDVLEGGAWEFITQSPCIQ